MVVDSLKFLFFGDADGIQMTRYGLPEGSLPVQVGLLNATLQNSAAIVVRVRAFLAANGGC